MVRSKHLGRGVDRATDISSHVVTVDFAFEHRKPQMGMRETSVWRRWLEDNWERYERIGVNVPLWWDIPVLSVDGKINAYIDFTQPLYRADAIAGKAEEVTLIEVKEAANVTAIGQLLTYEILLKRSYTGIRTIRKLLICATIRDGLQQVCDDIGIDVAVCPTPRHHTTPD